MKRWGLAYRDRKDPLRPFPRSCPRITGDDNTHLLVAPQDVVLGEVRLPNLKGLVIALDAIGLGTLKVGGVPRLERLNHSYMREGSRPYTLVSSSHAKSIAPFLK